MKIYFVFPYTLLCVLLNVLQRTNAQTYKYFQIHDVAHNCYVGAGKSYDGTLYHYKDNDLGDHTQWRFESADSGYYYIVDRRHGAAMSSDYFIINKYPGHLTTYKGYTNCMWRAEQATTIGAYWLKDKKYGLSIVGGDTYNGHIYIQSPGERRNAQWVLELVQNGDIGPDFYVVKQELLELTLDTNVIQRIEVAPLFAIDQIVSNNTSAEQNTSIEARKTETTTESWEFSKSITVSVAVSVQSSVGVKGIAEVSTSIETTYEESYSWTNAVEISKETEYLWTIPVIVPAHSSVQVTATIRKFTTQVPFTAVLKSTLGDGTTREDTVPGTWYGVDYLTGSVSYEELTGIEEKQLYPHEQPGLSVITRVSGVFINVFPCGDYQLSVYDMQGRSILPVYSGKSYEPFEVKLNPDMKGVYVLRLITGGKEYSQKAILIGMP
jgi:hypothetical protein